MIYWQSQRSNSTQTHMRLSVIWLTGGTHSIVYASWWEDVGKTLGLLRSQWFYCAETMSAGWALGNQQTTSDWHKSTPIGSAVNKKTLYCNDQNRRQIFEPNSLGTIKDFFYFLIKSTALLGQNQEVGGPPVEYCCFRLLKLLFHSNSQCISHDYN